MMRGGNATIGTWLQFPSADVAEVMGASGYDWVAVDMEHGAFTRAILPDVFRAIERGGSTPFARIAQAELRPIKDALDPKHILNDQKSYIIEGCEKNA